MAAPSPVERVVVYERDRHACVSCGTQYRLEFQHRQAVGMGGSKKRVNLAGGLTTCANCNPEYEAGLQTQALLYGWKVRKWVRDATRKHEAPERVPVWYGHRDGWHVLRPDGGRFWIPDARAREMMVEVYGPEYEQWEEGVL